ncbi:PhoH family protein [Robertmurraya andreesenii]|uniref:Ribonuclease YlaK n=1 Tax=Anoxybacillus andreesenii TaxID=1325932 RepID=A0ABT9V1Z1_9BACL|nr:PhoH family protein [Robertmurraya andreesenii]MDQ0154949.1 putative ribonuclease YlaK [Robertmurraya andreesenii]
MAYFGLSAKNEAQKRAMQALSNDKPFTFLTGPAGTGKTLIAQAVGLDSVIERRDHRKLVYTRLQTQVGMDVGALPGDLNEKTYPFVAPFMDNLDVLTEKPSEIKRYFSEGDDDKRKIFFDSIQTVRGRSLNHTFLLADEVQNLDIHTMAALATRPGLRAKFVFMGNFAQIDNAKLRKPEANGLYRLLAGLYEKEAFQYFDHVNLTETQRHPVVEIVEEILRNHEMAPEFAELEARGNV